MFVAVPESPPKWRRWLHGGGERTPFVSIFRFRLDGSYVDSRFARADLLAKDDRPLFFGAIDDERLVLAVDSPGGHIRVLGLEY